MASITKRGNRWRAFIRRTGYKSLSKTFDTKREAENWAASIEGNLVTQEPGIDMTFDDMVDKYIDELSQHKPVGKSKRGNLQLLRDYFGEYKARELTVTLLMEYFKKRAENVAPPTVAIDLYYLRSVLRVAKELWDVPVNIEALDTVSRYCRRHGLVDKPNERERRPTQQEIDDLVHWFNSNKRQRIPMAELTLFAIDTAMRMGEIVSLRWDDVDQVRKTVLIRSRKHPTMKKNNHQEVPLLGDSYKIIERQPKTSEFIFPYDSHSVTAAFCRATRKLKIEDLRFHDLRHEGISRLFEQGYSVMEVAKVSGHRDVNMLRRYVQLNAADLHDGPGIRRRLEF